MSGVKVLVGQTLTGRLTRSDLEEGVYFFVYNEAAGPLDAVSLTMPVVSDPIDSVGMIHPIFEMNLPEGALRRALELQFAKLVPDFDSLDLLSIVGRRQIGRLHYATDTLPDEALPGQSVTELLAYEGTEDLITSLMSRYAALSGISGVQPKVLLRDSAPSLDRVTDKGPTHIVKGFDPREYPELAANEYFSMKAAEYAGLPTAEVQLSANRQLLVVDRFDRKADGGYLGFEDFCVLMGLRSVGRYSRSYEELAQSVSLYVSPEHHSQAMRQLFGTVVLACAIRNGDAHLKNFGILYDQPGENVRLAPVYDMLSTAPYSPNDVLALTLNGSKAFPSKEQLVRYGRQSCGLTARQVEQIFQQIEEGLRQALIDLQTTARKRPDFLAAAAHFQQVFEEGVRFVAGE